MLVSDSLHDWSRTRGCADAIASHDASSQSGCSCDRTRRALSLLVDHATQRETFCVKLSDRQAIQWWISTSTISGRAKVAPGGIRLK
jgi:hypothetical protein